VQIGAGKLFELQNAATRAIGNGMVVRAGVAKGVRVVESEGKAKPSALALVLDGRLSPYTNITILDHLCLFSEILSILLLATVMDIVGAPQNGANGHMQQQGRNGQQMNGGGMGAPNYNRAVHLLRGRSNSWW